MYLAVQGFRGFAGFKVRDLSGLVLRFEDALSLHTLSSKETLSQECLESHSRAPKNLAAFLSPCHVFLPFYPF